MQDGELNNAIYVAARYGTSYEMDDDLYRKVKAEIRNNHSIRLIAAVTIYHVWLLRGKPNKTEWQYRDRIKYVIEVLTFFMSLSEEDRSNTGPVKSSSLLN